MIQAYSVAQKTDTIADGFGADGLTRWELEG